ncbi:MAG TPA: dodecin [Candidatus Thermoplasmatota archaeon]|nr:dodecin [Candidatus Thermoplasmatota archaeon]
MTVYKMIEVVGTSGTSIDDAIRGAIERASASVDDLQWFEVKEIRGRINKANAAEFQVKVNIGFVVHAPSNVEEVKKARGGKEATTRQTRSQVAQLVAKKGGRKRSDLARDFKRQSSK